MRAREKAKRLTRAGVPELEQVGAKIEPDLYAQLKAQAKAEERNISQTVRRAIRRYLGLDSPEQGA